MQEQQVTSDRSTEGELSTTFSIGHDKKSVPIKLHLEPSLVYLKRTKHESSSLMEHIILRWHSKNMAFEYLLHVHSSMVIRAVFV